MLLTYCFHLSFSTVIHTVPNSYSTMDLKKNIRFKVGSEDWEMPLGILLMLLGITLLLIIGGAYLGYKFGNSQF